MTIEVDTAGALFDALGDPIILGRRYGYHTSTSGWARVTTGIVVYTPSGKATMEDLTVQRFLYGKPTDFREDEIPKTVSINASFLFPVYKPMTAMDHTR